MPPQPHPLDETASELMTWLQQEPEHLAEAFRGGYATPFSAPVSEKEKLDYYRRKLFEQNPDGSINYEAPNKTGRTEMITRLGIEGYTQAVSVVLGKREPVLPDEPAPTEGY